tara:strand:- start:529 stop:903 length:375 start_codon:yes stop_codon:yes gene_type:complete
LELRATKIFSTAPLILQLDVYLHIAVATHGWILEQISDKNSRERLGLEFQGEIRIGTILFTFQVLISTWNFEITTKIVQEYERTSFWVWQRLILSFPSFASGKNTLRRTEDAIGSTQTQKMAIS